MENTIKSQKTIERIESIQTSLKLHRKNIKLLRVSFEVPVLIKRECFAPRIVKFTHIPKSEKVYRYTLENLKKQILLLERELAVLVEYGI